MSNTGVTPGYLINSQTDKLDLAFPLSPCTCKVSFTNIIAAMAAVRLIAAMKMFGSA